MKHKRSRFTPKRASLAVLLVLIASALGPVRRGEANVMAAASGPGSTVKWFSFALTIRGCEWRGANDVLCVLTVVNTIPVRTLYFEHVSAYDDLGAVHGSLCYHGISGIPPSGGGGIEGNGTLPQGVPVLAIFDFGGISRNATKFTALDLFPSVTSGSTIYTNLGQSIEFRNIPIVEKLTLAGHNAKGRHSAPTVRLFVQALNGMSVRLDGSARPATPGDTILKIVWNWGDGSSEQTGWFPESHTYRAAGIYTITVKATEVNGAIGSARTGVEIQGGRTTPSRHQAAK